MVIVMLLLAKIIGCGAGRRQPKLTEIYLFSPSLASGRVAGACGTAAVGGERHAGGGEVAEFGHQKAEAFERVGTDGSVFDRGRRNGPGGGR